ncbi:hypothetical protein MKW98_021135 [Papaver atlanticum]|uniref:Uncharacterized protein n=1 Tax=Papaver atlanticum TaxID=357466 RepID=A0AAD4TA27_9MAGN|nr:hypothetical protein MKW98_021135 [Papaver atlanticum]
MIKGHHCGQVAYEEAAYAKNLLNKSMMRHLWVFPIKARNFRRGTKFQLELVVASIRANFSVKRILACEQQAYYAKGRCYISRQYDPNICLDC